MRHQCISIVAGLVLAGPAPAAVWTVDDDLIDNPKAQFSQIWEAIEVAADGDEILVSPGTYSNSWDGCSIINPMGKALYIHSTDGPDVTVLDGQCNWHGIVCESGETAATIIEGFAVTNGASWQCHNGSAFYANQASPIVRNCTFDGALSCGGGPMVEINGSSPRFEACRFLNMGSGINVNSVGFDDPGDPGSEIGSNPIFSQCRFADNQQVMNIDFRCAPVLYDSVLCNNGGDFGGCTLCGPWQDGGGNCFAFSCEDSDGDGQPDKCQSVGDGVHEVPAEFPTSTVRFSRPATAMKSASLRAPTPW